MRVLLVSQYFLPQPLANAEVVGGVAEALARRGHVVDVVTPVAGPSATNVKRHRAIGFFPEDRSNAPLRVAEYLAFSFGALVSGLMTPRPDVVLVPSPPPTLGVIGVVLGILRRVPVVYNVQDLYPEVALASGAVQSGMFLSALRRVMGWVYRRAAAVVVIDGRFVTAIRTVAPDANVVAIRNAIDQSVLDGADRDEGFLAELGVRPGRPVVMYAGNVGRSQDLEIVARAAGAAGAEFIVHGGGAGLEQLRRAAGAEGWAHVHFSGYRDRRELGRVFASADLHVVPLKAGVASASVPSKLLSIFTVGRPAVVTAEADSAVGDVLAESGGGWLVPPGDEPALRTAIIDALSDRDELARRGRAAHAWSIDGAALERVGREYEDVLAATMTEDGDS